MHIYTYLKNTFPKYDLQTWSSHCKPFFFAMVLIAFWKITLDIWRVHALNIELDINVHMWTVHALLIELNLYVYPSMHALII